mgnify:FL=1
MRRTFIPAAVSILLGAGFAVDLVAQQDQADLAKLRDKKLKSSFLKKAAWFTDFDEARAKAQKDGKIIFTYFTRSYAP